MEERVQTVWRRAKESIRDSLSTSTYEMWFERTHAAGMDDDTFVVSVPNDFTKNRIEERFLPLIEETISRQIDAGRSDVDLTALDNLFERHPLDQHVIHAFGQEVRVDALTHGEVALRVHIDGQHPLAHLPEGNADIQGRGRFGDPTLLIGKGENDCHVTFLPV